MSPENSKEVIAMLKRMIQILESNNTTNVHFALGVSFEEDRIGDIGNNNVVMGGPHWHLLELVGQMNDAMMERMEELGTLPDELIKLRRMLKEKEDKNQKITPEMLN